MSGSPPIPFVEVTTRALDGLPDARGDSVRSMLAADHGIEVGNVRVSLGYQVQAELTSEQIERTVYDLFADPVIERGSCNGALLATTGIFPSSPEAAIQGSCRHLNEVNGRATAHRASSVAARP